MNTLNTFRWKLANQVLEIALRPLVMGIVNITPDSFSDGGHFFDHQRAIEQGIRLAAEGADILDVGGESTRPGSTPIPVAEELHRVVAVVKELACRVAVPISIDTMKVEVARRCLEAGASIVNDVAGLRDPAMVQLVAQSGTGVIVMHMKGTPQTMHLQAEYSDVVLEVRDYFREKVRTLEAAGIDRECICIDPGIGFGKGTVHNLELLANLAVLQEFDRPLCLGVSRKGFIGKLCNREQGERMPGSLAVACIAAARGQAQILRVHDVAATRDATIMLEEINRYRR